MAYKSPLFLLGLSSSPVTVQGGFRTPLPNWNAGGNASVVVQGGFRTPLPFFNAGGGVELEVEDTQVRGGRAKRKLIFTIKSDFVDRDLSFESEIEDLTVSVPPLKTAFNHTSEDLQKEIQRYTDAVDALKTKVNLAKVKTYLDREFLKSETKRAREFQLELLFMIQQLRSVKLRRQEEEVIIAVLMADN